MKRIAAPRAPGGPSRTGEANASTRISYPNTGRWTAPTVSQAWAPGNGLQDGDQIWPDCCD